MSEERIEPCAGGWCLRRTGCEHYVNPTDRTEPAERLCKRQGPDHFVPLGALKRGQA